MIKMLTYEEAQIVGKRGGLIARRCWNGKNQFAFIRPGDELSIDTIVHKVKSLPNNVKWFFANQTNPNINNGIDEETLISFKPYWCLKNAQNEIINGWIPSQTDLLADDWYEVLV